jgi:ATP-dependent Clp protease ATP-binding subunit ClpA
LYFLHPTLAAKTFSDRDGSDDPEDKEKMKETIQQIMKSQFKPEFLNRIDEQVFFTRRSRENLHKIIKLEVKSVQKRRENCDMKLILTDDTRLLGEQWLRPIVRSSSAQAYNPKRIGDEGCKGNASR